MLRTWHRCRCYLHPTPSLCADSNLTPSLCADSNSTMLTNSGALCNQSFLPTFFIVVPSPSMHTPNMQHQFFPYCTFGMYLRWMDIAAQAVGRTRGCRMGNRFRGHMTLENSNGLEFGIPRQVLSRPRRLAPLLPLLSNYFCVGALQSCPW